MKSKTRDALFPFLSSAISFFLAGYFLNKTEFVFSFAAIICGIYLAKKIYDIVKRKK